VWLIEEGVFGDEAHMAPRRVSPPYLMERGASGRSAPARFGSADQVGGTGTGYGREIGSSIYYVSFVRSANWRAITNYYDTEEALRQLGVPLDRPMPSPFPADGPKFVPPPPGYMGR
jgi:hypothetical protein